MTTTANGNGHRTAGAELLSPEASALADGLLAAQRSVAGPEQFCPPSSAFTGLTDEAACREAQAADRRKELAHWWHNIAEQDLAMLLPKAAEYSAHDLRMTGHVLADMMGIEVDDAFAAELACATYLMSKVTRILGAYKEGRLPSMDSVVDARVYATMMARIRERGGWPGWESGI